MTTAYELAYVRKEEEPVLAAPLSEVGAIGWLRANLFSSTTNAILTLLGVALVVWIVPPIFRWAFLEAVWDGDSREACIAPGAGACWAFVKAKFAQFMYGRYPLGERWRVDLTAVLLIAGLIPLAIPRVPFKRENAIFMLVVFPIMALILLTGGNIGFPIAFVGLLAFLGLLAVGGIALATASPDSPLLVGRAVPMAMALAVALYVAGIVFPAAPIAFGRTILELCSIAAGLVAALGGLAGIMATPGRPGLRNAATIWLAIAAIVVVLLIVAADFGLTFVETQLWGGLLVTLVVAIVGMVASLPLGILLALGRRSKLPAVRYFSVAFIELWRGVPLITVLFMASVMLPVFLPPGVNFDKLLRALIGVALFTSAYMAEAIRGGLQAIPKGQFEAAAAVGLNYAQTMRLIILPQALKISIPSIVNSFISLFKDTSLVLIIGLFDLLGIVQLNFADSNWASPGTPATGYVFAAVVFWAFCFGMSRYSMYTERRLHTGHKR